MFIADKKLNSNIIKKLRTFDTVFLLETSGITYNAISGHPDIFFCKTDDQLIASPDLTDLPLKYIPGVKKVGHQYPESACYNAVVTSQYLIHNLKLTDNQIKLKCSHKKHIHVKQGYTRCNLLPLTDNLFISSDKGIINTLRKNKLEVLYFDPGKIILPGFANGFLGGCCGIFQKKVLLTGSLKYHKDGIILEKTIIENGLEIVELYDGPLFDGGSIIHIEE